MMGSAFQSISVDETLNSAGAIELQVVVTYWSNTRGRVATHHLETFFIGEATGEALASKIMQAINNANLSINKLLMLGMDGPNVNKKVHRIISEKVMQERGKSLLDIGSRNIHILHNAFLKGVERLGEGAADLLTKIYFFFDGWLSN